MGAGGGAGGVAGVAGPRSTARGGRGTAGATGRGQGGRGLLTSITVRPSARGTGWNILPGTGGRHRSGTGCRLTHISCRLHVSGLTAESQDTERQRTRTAEASHRFQANALYYCHVILRCPEGITQSHTVCTTDSLVKYIIRTKISERAVIQPNKLLWGEF